MIDFLKRDIPILLLLLLFTAFGLGVVYWMNYELGMNPQLWKALRIFSIIFLALPLVIALRLLAYKGSIRLLILALTLMSIGYTIRYDIETKRDDFYYRKLAAGEVKSDDMRGPETLYSRVEPVGKAVIGYFALLAVFYFLRGRTDTLRIGIIFKPVLVLTLMIFHRLGSLVSGGRFIFGFTGWDIALPILVITMADYLADHYRSLGDWKKLSEFEPIYWVPLLILWLGPVAGFIIIGEFGVFVILGIYIILSLYLSTRRIVFVAASLAVITLLGLIAVHYDLAPGHIGVRLSIWTDFYHNFPEKISPYEPLMNNEDFLDWLGNPNKRLQHLNGFLAIWHGGMTGAGLGLGYPIAIPVAVSDFIGVALAENLGLAGLLTVTLIYILFTYHCFRLSMQMKAVGRFAVFTLQGIGLMILIQFIVSLAGPLSILPMTGVPMPLVSRSYSALIAALAAVGLAMVFEHQVALLPPPAEDHAPPVAISKDKPLVIELKEKGKK